MDDVKDKVKGFMKKVNNPFSSSSSSSGKFKGQGRVLGSSSSGSSNSINSRPSPNAVRKENQSNSVAPSNTVSKSPLPPPQNNPNSERTRESRLNSHNFPNSESKPKDGFDPFDSLVTSGKRSLNGYSVNVFECPVCGQAYKSEEEVTTHVDSCLSESAERVDLAGESMDNGSNNVELQNELVSRIGAFVSGGLSEGSSIEIVVKLLRNIVKEPENAKFRRIRMSNPKIREAIGSVPGGIELLECVGFILKEEDEEMWAVMEVPSKDQIFLITEAISLLEPKKKTEDLPSTASTKVVSPVVPKKVGRQVRVFFSVPESIAAKINIPDSFYNLSAEELKREADLRKKKIAESQLLIPKSYKEKQTQAARRRYKNTVIRIQFPDQVVLQGVFSPWEPTTVLYEFVSSALKEPSLEFELLHPVVIKRRMIPRFPQAGGKTPTLDEEDLVPSALIKFKPLETDSIVFTGLRNELLEISEPLSANTT